ncbi:transcriptional regulator (plasmid) [Burkholderia sp. PAMC 26561]|nr:LysR family transcriptional regulator [Burkholderia sp. PAMC 26561]AME27391.1 transcriptional regulator [Burkholderia sp. PAMC 26561]AME28074.1 transcriptional regulator [Burkholderia sp. PAMC 26561]
MPNLPALEVFLAVARHQSFRRAAKERGVGPSALSHAVRSLEETLDMRLFNRTNRSICLTEAGEHLLRRVAPALGEIAEAIEEIGLLKSRPTGTLRLNVPRNAAELVIKPVMTEFLAAYPGITLEVVTDDGIVDIVGKGFDAGIRAAPDLSQDMISIPVGPRLRFAVVGSPGYFTGRDMPGAPHDLTGHACIGRRYPSGAIYPWVFAKDSEEIKIDVSGPLIADDRALIIAGALSGIGLAHIHEALVADQLARGELVRVLEEWCPTLPTFFLYYPGRRQLPAPLRAFIDMFRSRAWPGHNV